ncbi:MAG: PilZ domain-containing protein [Acidobacteriota bacterium]
MPPASTVTAKNAIGKARFESLRVPIDCQVELKLEPSSPAKHMIAGNISMRGMFIRGSELYEPGTVCEVRFVLLEDEPPIRGTAEILWSRNRDLGPDRPKGIGIRFLELDLEAKYQVSRLVDQYIRLDGLPLQIGADLPNAPSTTARRWLRPALVLPVVFCSGLAIGSIGSLWLTRPPDEAVELGFTAESPRAFATPSLSTPVRLQPEEESVAAVEIEARVLAWAAAWAGKDIPEYLSFYSDDFEPATGSTLEAWKARRRERLSRPGFIEVELSAIEIETLGAGRAIARFDQAFASPGYRDRVAKNLELTREGMVWKIVREAVSPSTEP